jgi:hypothetical protein
VLVVGEDNNATEAKYQGNKSWRCLLLGYNKAFFVVDGGMRDACVSPETKGVDGTWRSEDKGRTAMHRGWPFPFIQWEDIAPAAVGTSI